MAQDITTIKINKKTKERLNHLKVYHRETYDEILKSMLDILNICRQNPIKAQSALLSIEKRKRKENIKSIKEHSNL